MAGKLVYCFREESFFLDKISLSSFPNPIICQTYFFPHKLFAYCIYKHTAEYISTEENLSAGRGESRLIGLWVPSYVWPDGFILALEGRPVPLCSTSVILVSVSAALHPYAQPLTRIILVSTPLAWVTPIRNLELPTSIALRGHRETQATPPHQGGDPEGTRLTKVRKVSDDRYWCLSSLFSQYS